MSSCKNSGYGFELRLSLSSPDSNSRNLSAETHTFSLLKLKSGDFATCLTRPIHCQPQRGGSGFTLVDLIVTLDGSLLRRFCREVRSWFLDFPAWTPASGKSSPSSHSSPPCTSWEVTSDFQSLCPYVDQLAGV